MSSRHVDYHTHNFITKYIYSDWSLYGLKAKYVKTITILLVFGISLLLKQLIVPELNDSPFVFIYIVIIIASFLSGFKGGFFIILIAITVLELRAYQTQVSILDRNIYIFLIEGICLSYLIEKALRVIKLLGRQADLLTLSSDAIIVRSLDNDQIIYWSAGAEKMYGFKRFEASNKVIFTLLQTQAKTPIEAIKIELLEKGEWEGELRQVKKNNKQIGVLSRWYIKKNDEDRPAVIVEINTDITKQKALERRKDEFLSIASHELKTPVTSIKAFTQILESRFKKIGDVTSQTYLSKMNVQLNRLTNLVNDLLDSTRVEAGKLELNTEFFSISSLIDEVIENIQLTSQKHTIIKKGESRELVWGDKDRTEQVLINLINNAIKYSPRSDKVIVTMYDEEGFVKIGVEDRGIGIAKNKIHKIFDRFYRVDSKEGEFTGLGLGLYISAEIIRRQDGQMWVESEEKVGSTFYFTLPTKHLKK
ncbi:MAG: ATP-binding protein [Patescibacteria group bacterium]